MVGQTVRVENTSNGLIVQVLVWHTEKSDHAAKTARRVCTAAKPEDEDLIARVPHVRQEFIAVLNLLKETIAHRSTKEVFKGRTVCPYAAVVVLQLRWIIRQEQIDLPNVRVFR